MKEIALTEDVKILTEREIKKIFQQILFLSSLGFFKSIKEIYSELVEMGYEFSLWNSAPEQIHMKDKDYKWLKVKFTLEIIHESGIKPMSKSLATWTSYYVMTLDDIAYNNWLQSNVSLSKTNSIDSEILEACNIQIDSLDFFQQKFSSS